MRDKIYPHIDTTVVNNCEYTFTCTNCKYTEQRLQMTAKGGKLVQSRFINAHKNCKPIKQNT